MRAEHAEFHPTLDTDEAHLKFNHAVLDPMPFFSEPPSGIKDSPSPQMLGVLTQVATLSYYSFSGIALTKENCLAMGIPHSIQ